MDRIPPDDRRSYNYSWQNRAGTGHLVLRRTSISKAGRQVFVGKWF
jgi:hypothetical protein